MKAIAGDPKILSILNQRKGHRGWRELQGDNLKETLLSMIKVEVVANSLNYFLVVTSLYVSYI